MLPLTIKWSMCLGGPSPPYQSLKTNENGVCVSNGGPSPSYQSDGKPPPKSAYPQFKYLDLWKVFSWKTCCSSSHMQSASLPAKNLATYGEATQDCLDLFQLLERSICPPKFGIQRGPPRICASFCNRVFQACSDAYFTSNDSNQVIVPCGAKEDVICGKASKLESNGTAFCYAMSFTVQTAGHSAEEPCCGSSAIVELFLGYSGLMMYLLLNRLEKQRERLARVQRDARRLRRGIRIGRRVLQR